MPTPHDHWGTAISRSRNQRLTIPDNVFNLTLQDDTGDDPSIGQDANGRQRGPEKYGDADAGRTSIISRPR